MSFGTPGGPAGILGDVTSRAVSRVFVGREAELGALAGAFDEAAGGTPGTVLIGAEAGGGKSRLVSEFTTRVRDRALVLAGGCVDLGAVSLPYAPFTAALRQLVRERGTEEVAGLLPGHDARELAGLLPEFGLPVAAGDPEMARGRLFGLLLTLLEQLAAPRSLVLVIEDLHWADASTGDLLAYLVRNVRQAAVLLVVTFRSDELARGGPLRRLLAGLGRLDGVTSLELARLSRREVAAQLAGILGRPPEPAVSAEVYDRGAGNPLFTEALLEAGGTISAGLPWSLRELLLSAVKELPEPVQQVLRAAAPGASRVGHRLLAAVTGLGDTALTAALRPAVDASVVITDSGGYAFRHELFREAVREDMLPGELAEAHRAFAEALAADPSLSPEYRVPVQLALHWNGAGEYERALRAARAAAGRGRDQAAAWLPRAAELAAGVGARPLLEQVTRLARAARVDLPAAAGAGSPAAPFGLTGRELEVLRLVAAGRSNQQIAAELFISPKTASVHVSNILAKLRVSSRVEAATTAHRLHLFDPG